MFITHRGIQLWLKDTEGGPIPIKARPCSASTRKISGVVRFPSNKAFHACWRATDPTSDCHYRCEVFRGTRETALMRKVYLTTAQYMRGGGTYSTKGNILPPLKPGANLWLPRSRLHGGSKRGHLTLIFWKLQHPPTEAQEAAIADQNNLPTSLDSVARDGQRAAVIFRLALEPPPGLKHNARDDESGSGELEYARSDSDTTETAPVQKTPLRREKALNARAMASSSSKAKARLRSHVNLKPSSPTRKRSDKAPSGDDSESTSQSDSDEARVTKILNTAKTLDRQLKKVQREHKLAKMRSSALVEKAKRRNTETTKRIKKKRAELNLLQRRNKKLQQLVG
ncbi:hypothetical protein MKEN_01235500 [Mycena kentingensis (nom. inval.)]|nr:hypothetical protein MKEN_01235500 [Mycena kentingensis (nom. inval.)]